MSTVEVEGVEGKVTIRRQAYGFPHIRAAGEIDLYYGLGFAHGRDRQVHIWLLKLLGQGRASEQLSGDDALVESDRFMRWIDLTGYAARSVGSLTPDARMRVEAYCRGVNAGASAAGTPFEFRLVGYRRDDWTPTDVLLIVAMTGFIGLAQSQGEVEKLVVQLLQKLDVPRLRELFPVIGGEISDELIEVLRQVRVERSVVPPAIAWRALLPGFQASNNWAVGPGRSATGNALLCGDPHLPLQIPSIWYLATLSAGDFFLSGATVPGTPLVGVGRTRDVAWAATYGTADVSDYFVEEVRGGRYRRGSDWHSFRIREEILQPKRKPPVELRVYENDHGLLEGNPDQDGYYLSYAWAARQRENAAAESLEQFFRLVHAGEVEDAMRCFAGMPFAAFNWVMADRGGNIGYQLSGCIPRRREGTTGLVPYLGWDPENDWLGVLDPTEHPRLYNPPEGMIVTANQDLNRLGRVPVMTVPMSSYRADRIAAWLDEKDRLTVEDMKCLHYDRYSLQAKAFMVLFRPLLPATENGEILRSWDLRYEADSRGAYLFDRVYEELVKLVFGEKGMGVDVVAHLQRETPLFAFLHGNFDRVLLDTDSVWFRGESRESLLRMAIERGLAAPAVPHGRARRITVPNLFFGGQLPRFLGFDYTLEHLGSAATAAQGQLFKVAGRITSFAPSLRVICDLGRDDLHANIAGGASDRRFSPHYTSGFDDWLRGRYASFAP